MNLFQHIKEKYLGDTDTTQSDLFITEQVNSFDNINLDKLLNKDILVETTDGTYFGTFGKFKGKWALYEDTFVKNIIIPENIVKVICENVKIVIDKPEKKRKHRHTIVDNSDGELIQEEIHKRGDEFVVTTEGGEKVLGTHPTKEKAQKQLAAIEISKHSMNENVKLLLRDRLKSRFFGNISEEVVNPENEFTMTDPEILKRDNMADAMLRSPKFKPKLKGKDTKENAAHRIATFQIMGPGRNKHGYEPSLYSHGRDDSAPKRTRKQKRNDARITMDDEGEKKYNKKLLKSTRKKIANTNRTTGLSGSSKNVPKNRQKAERQKASKRTVTDRKTFANARGSDRSTMAANRQRRLAANIKNSPYFAGK